MIANEKKTIGIQTFTPQIQKAENQDNSLRSDKWKKELKENWLDSPVIYEMIEKNKCLIVCRKKIE